MEVLNRHTDIANICKEFKSVINEQLFTKYRGVTGVKLGLGRARGGGCNSRSVRQLQRKVNCIFLVLVKKIENVILMQYGTNYR